MNKREIHREFRLRKSSIKVFRVTPSSKILIVRKIVFDYSYSETSELIVLRREC